MTIDLDTLLKVGAIVLACLMMALMMLWLVAMRSLGMLRDTQTEMSRQLERFNERKTDLVMNLVKHFQPEKDE